MGESVVPDSEGDREREEPVEDHDIDHEGVRYLLIINLDLLILFSSPRVPRHTSSEISRSIGNDFFSGI